MSQARTAVQQCNEVRTRTGNQITTEASRRQRRALVRDYNTGRYKWRRVVNSKALRLTQATMAMDVEDEACADEPCPPLPSPLELTALRRRQWLEVAAQQPSRGIP